MGFLFLLPLPILLSPSQPQPRWVSDFQCVFGHYAFRVEEAQRRCRRMAAPPGSARWSRELGGRGPRKRKTPPPRAPVSPSELVH
jgi:hypothetical protein